MIRDRGNIKWTAMMLPEHVSAIREFISEKNYVVKPELDEQEITIIEETVAEGMADNLMLEFLYYINGRIETVIGRVHCIDTFAKKFLLIDGNDNRFNLPFADIISAAKSDN